MPRTYLGMSSIGDPCERKLWYSFRHAMVKQHSAETIKRFEDGHAGETLQAARLRLVPAIELHTQQADGSQFGFRMIGNHFSGHMDGAIYGLLQAPNTWHVWEHKQVGEKKFNELKKFKAAVGEKAALEKWDETYHGQAVMYMHASGMSRHYLTCSTPGGRNTISVRTNKAPKKADALLAKAKRIITTDRPPARINEDPAWYVCKLCDYSPVCHGTQVPAPTCRSCIHATAELDGDARWSCAHHRRDLTKHDQLNGCDAHRFIPDLLANWATFDDADEVGMYFINKATGGKFYHGSGGYSSIDLYRSVLAVVGDPVVDSLKKEMGATLESAEVIAS